ncbi:MAG TPA: hypothetical protein ENK85_01220, partial [Saprospiraceae bacterium]|nr:hypothetical protein [Saprospiraceae bacterium]
MKNLLPVLFGLLFFANISFAQKGQKILLPKKTTSSVRAKPLGSLKRAALPAGSSFFTNTLQRFQPLEKPTRQGLSNVKIGQPIEVVAFSPQGRPTWVKGSLAINTRGIDAEDQAFLYLDELKNKMGIEHPMEEFQISKQQQDEYGQTHIRMEQYYHGLPVYAGEVIL